MLKKHFSIMCALFVAVLCSPSAFALISDGGESYYNDPQVMTFSSGSSVPIAEIASEVYHNYGASSAYEGKYVYTYQIANISNTKLSYFSITIPASGGIDELSPAYESGANLVDPFSWTTAGSPLESVHAMFSDTISNGEKSALLYFVSDHAPGLGEGALLSLSPSYELATGPLNVPVPEPATMVLLSCGYLSILFFRKKPV